MAAAGSAKGAPSRSVGSIPASRLRPVSEVFHTLPGSCVQVSEFMRKWATESKEPQLPSSPLPSPRLAIATAGPLEAGQNGLDRFLRSGSAVVFETALPVHGDARHPADMKSAIDPQAADAAAAADSVKYPKVQHILRCIIL